SPASCCSPSRCGRSCRGEPQSWVDGSPLRRRLLPLQRSHPWGWELRRLGCGTLLQPGEHLGDGAIELRIDLGEELPGSVLDLDIGLDAEILHTPVLALEPERIAGLSHLGAVDEFVAAVDADHTAPGAHADDRADPLGLDAGVDDVAVGTGELIGHEDHWPARRVLRIGDHPVVAAGAVPADDP